MTESSATYSSHVRSDRLLNRVYCRHFQIHHSDIVWLETRVQACRCVRVTALLVFQSQGENDDNVASGDKTRKPKSESRSQPTEENLIIHQTFAANLLRIVSIK